MPSVRKIYAVWARQIAELLEVRGLPPQLVLREVGLDWKKVREPDARIPYAKHAALLEAAAEHLDDPCLLRSGLSPPILGQLVLALSELGQHATFPASPGMSLVGG